MNVKVNKFRFGSLATIFALVGPGIVVMLADTDAGSVITAAQSGATFKYQLIASQILLIPILYLVQEMTARLGIYTQKGHGALILQTFGRKWAVFSAITLFVACVGALITEFAGVSGVGNLLGIPSWLSIGASSIALSILILVGRYRRVEKIGIAIGALELLFIPAAIFAHPKVGEITNSFAHSFSTNTDYLKLLAANVGAVIMPWMIFYQQEAIIDKGRRNLQIRSAIKSARFDTALGAVITQLVMISILIVTGATLGKAGFHSELNNVGDISNALKPFLGENIAVVVFGLGMIGASLVATIVVTLAGAWGISEVFSWPHSLNDKPRKAVGFYALAICGILIGAFLVIFSPNLVKLSIDVEVLNAALLPIVLGFLLALEKKALKPEHQMKGLRKVITYLLTGLVITFGLYIIVQTFANFKF